MTDLKPATGKAYLFLLTTALIWGGNAVAGKMAVGHVSPFLMTLIRWVIAFGLIVTISVPQLRQDWPAIRRNWLYLLLMGATGFTGFNALLYTALHYTSAINAVIEQAGMPFVIFVANFFIFRMRATGGQVVGFLLTLSGIALTAANGDLQTLLSLKLNFGDLLMLFAVLVYAAYTVGLRFKPELHWKSMMAATAGGAMIAAIPLGVYEWWNGAAQVPDAKGWAVVAFIAIFPSLFAQTLFVRGVEIIGSNRAGLFINLVPIFGMLLSIGLIGEPLHVYHIVSLVLVLGGIVMAERNRPAAIV
ncbi:DMT family transporter [Rhizobium sp. C1]|uniref:DMT family transporter n=1 Tax=Rhizobium sp. C1 TaxID=1349799 RepID=UPI001E427837|nr:DMT family transporter [Rhizobium sp. C1]MCD2180151.1 DMT family transporter [Rhizobium sp. C1]